MAAIKEGATCIKTSGRKSGEKVTIVKIVDANFVEVKDEKGKVKRCNITHLEPLMA